MPKPREKLRFTALSPEAELEQREQDDPGSTQLPIFKQERFCQFYLKGISIEKAYEKAGYSGSSSGNAIRTFQRPEVQRRIAWLVAESARLAVVDSGYVKRRLKDIVDLALETSLDEDGDRKPASTFNLSAANKALELLGKDLGMFKERIELGGQLQVANADLFRKMTPDERQAMREMLVAAAARMPVPANQNADGAADKEQSADAV